MVDFVPTAPTGNIPPVGDNPLRKYFRQPKIYIELPSKGKFYPIGAIDYPETGELGIMPMTAKDELALKTPDALLNGQATVDVIQSCIPAIKNAWAIPSIDIDAILIAIRIATYGEEIELTTTVPKINEQREFKTDLRHILNELVTQTYYDEIIVEDVSIKTRPLTYKEFTESAMKTFEQQRLFKIVNNESLSEEEKLSEFSRSFKKLTDLTVDTLTKSIASVSIEGTTVNNLKHIKEFIDNADKSFFNKVSKHLEEQRKKFTIKPFVAKLSDEDVANGAPETVEIPITFDQANFFG